MNRRVFLVPAVLVYLACGDAAGPTTSNAQHWALLTSGTYHSCGLTVDGLAYCWGLNPSGALGARDSVRATVRPVPVVTDLSFKSISVSGPITCGISTVGRAYCWGAGFYGGLGDGLDKSSPLPVAVAGDRIFTQISVGAEHVCALAPTGDAYCWGLNQFGQIGDGSKTQRSVPTRVNSDVPFKAISAGNLQTCALGVDGTAYCWGGASYGEAGNPCDTVPCDWLTPRPVATDQKFASIAAANVFTCALSISGDAWCWGGLPLPWTDAAAKLGILGNGSLSGSAVPVKVVGNHHFTEIAAGTRSACAITDDSDMYCWGDNTEGELGIGSYDDDGHPTPTRVTVGIKFSHVTVGDGVCALDQQGAAYCWAVIVGTPDATGGIRIEGLLTRPTLLQNPQK
ncbi:MAG TPA: hypothetical protein VJS39_01780 [Gemmatimonadaceae bacterium]|nr:hypothetical protein [Gemmatimonadaceae bacterium]